MNYEKFSAFRPEEYLCTYYKDIDFGLIRYFIGRNEIINKNTFNTGQENAHIMRFYASRVLAVFKQKFNSDVSLLEAGVGPTVCQLISLAPYVESFYLTDYCLGNLSHLVQWKNSPNNFWRKFICAALMMEKDSDRISDQEIIIRERLIKDKIKRLSRYDVINDKMTCKAMDIKKFDIVLSNFCLESITCDFVEWKKSLSNLTNRLKTGGLLIMAALKDAKCYNVEDKLFPAVAIDEQILSDELKDLGYSDIDFGSIVCAESANHYQGMVFLTAIKRAKNRGDKNGK